MISEHFTIDDLTRSDTATRLGLDNTPSERERAALVRLCRDVLEPVRRAFGRSFRIVGGYRCRLLNHAEGGEMGNDYTRGEAADIDAGEDNRRLFRLISSMIDRGELCVGRLLWVGGTPSCPGHIHISLPVAGAVNNQILYVGIKTKRRA